MLITPSPPLHIVSSTSSKQKLGMRISLITVGNYQLIVAKKKKFHFKRNFQIWQQKVRKICGKCVWNILYIDGKYVRNVWETYSWSSIPNLDSLKRCWPNRFSINTSQVKDTIFLTNTDLFHKFQFLQKKKN